MLILCIELLGRGRLSRTSLFHHHGIRLSKSVDPKTLKDQVSQIKYVCILILLLPNRLLLHTVVVSYVTMVVLKIMPSQYLMQHFHSTKTLRGKKKSAKEIYIMFCMTF